MNDAPKPRPYKKDKWDCVSEILNHYKDPNSDGYRFNKLIFDAHCVDDVTDAIKSLEASMDRSAQASDLLGRRVFWLNVILAILTGIGATYTIIGAIYTIRSFYGH